MSFSKFKHLATNDYQKRDGAYPKSNVPTDIRVQDDYIIFAFKNTDERSARDFAETFASRNKIQFSKIDSSQDGDYEDDWVEVLLYPVEEELAICPTCYTSAGPAYLNDDEINCNQCGETFNINS